jgi:hypothetical protein
MEGETGNEPKMRQIWQAKKRLGKRIEGEFGGNEWTKMPKKKRANE